MPASAAVVPGVGQIVFLVRGKLHLVQGIHVEILGRYLPGDMWSENSGSNEKWLVTLLLHFT